MSGLLPLATTTLKGPHVDFAALSPLIALLGGAAIVLLVGLLGSRWIRAQLVPALSLLVPPPDRGDVVAHGRFVQPVAKLAVGRRGRPESDRSHLGLNPLAGTQSNAIAQHT